MRIFAFKEKDREKWEKYWESLVGDAEHPHTKCVEKLTGKMDNPHAFCSALQKFVTGKGPRSSSLRKLKGGGFMERRVKADLLGLRLIFAQNEEVPFEVGDEVETPYGKGEVTEIKEDEGIAVVNIERKEIVPPEEALRKTESRKNRKRVIVSFSSLKKSSQEERPEDLIGEEVAVVGEEKEVIGEVVDVAYEPEGSEPYLIVEVEREIEIPLEEIKRETEVEKEEEEVPKEEIEKKESKIRRKVKIRRRAQYGGRDLYHKISDMPSEYTSFSLGEKYEEYRSLEGKPVETIAEEVLERAEEALEVSRDILSSESVPESVKEAVRRKAGLLGYYLREFADLLNKEAQVEYERKDISEMKYDISRSTYDDFVPPPPHEEPAFSVKEEEGKLFRDEATSRKVQVSLSRETVEGEREQKGVTKAFDTSDITAASSKKDSRIVKEASEVLDLLVSKNVIPDDVQVKLIEFEKLASKSLEELRALKKLISSIEDGQNYVLTSSGQLVDISDLFEEE